MLELQRNSVNKSRLYILDHFPNVVPTVHSILNAQLFTLPVSDSHIAERCYAELRLRMPWGIVRLRDRQTEV